MHLKPAFGFSQLHCVGSSQTEMDDALSPAVAKCVVWHTWAIRFSQEKYLFDHSVSLAS